MKNSIKIIQWSLVVVGVATFGCSSVNHLRDYQFREKTIAAEMPAAPQPQVFTDSFVWFDEDNPIQSVLSAGTTIAKEVEASKARARLDSAMEQIDVPEQIKNRALQKCAQVLRSSPIDDSDHSEFLLDLEIRKYGIEAKSWTTATQFKIDLTAQIFDNQSGALVWRRKIDEKQPISSDIFGLGHSVNNVITAVTLSNLSVEEIASGFEHLADYTADRIARKLREDFAKVQHKD